MRLTKRARRGRGVSDGARVALGLRRKIDIEDGGDGSDEQTAAGRYLDPRAVQANQSIIDEHLQAHELALEGQVRPAVPRRNRLQIDGEITHQSLDDVATEAILVRNGGAARDRQFAATDGGAPGQLLGGVLDKSLRQAADRRGAKPEQGPG